MRDSTRTSIRWLSALALILLALFTGDSDAIDPANIQDNAALPAGNLATPNRIGQTFLSRYPQLHAIQVRWIRSGDSPRPSRVTLHLHRADGPEELLAVSIPSDEIANDRFTKFVFPAQPDSQNQTYYFWLDASDDGNALSLWSSAADDYPDGEMRVNDVPIRRDLVFRAYYEPDLPMLLDALARMLTRFGGALVAAILLFVLPGVSLGLALGGPARQAIARSSGLGLAMLSASALVFLWLGLPLIGIGSVVAMLGAIGIARVVMSWRASVTRQCPSRNLEITPSPTTFLTMIVAALSLCIGLLQIRDVAAPLWVDSLTHAEYIQTLVEQNRLPGAFYHLGYHVIVALFAQFAREPIPQAMLIVGQLLLTQVGLSIWFLTKRMTGSDSAALASASVVWFLAPTPLYLVTWGRYPLVLGAAILPMALVYAIELIEPPRARVRTFILAAVTAGGLAFAHIRLVAFYALFVALYAGMRRRGGVRLALLLAPGIVFGAMWLVALAARGVGLPAILAQNVAAPEIDLGTAMAVAQTHHGPMVWLLALVGVVVGIARRAHIVLIVAAWYAGMLLASALLPDFLPLSLVVLTGFLPAALVIGDLARWIETKTTARDFATVALSVVTFSIVVLAGARDVVSFVNPATVLFTDADAAAMEWIETHTPADARFLVNSMVWFDANYVPSDGGGWIPYTAGRAVEYVRAPADADTLARGLTARQIGYVYIGWRGGVLNRAEFAAQSERYARVYAREGVEIIAVGH